MHLREIADNVQQDLHYAVRGLARRPGFTAAVVITLALGMGANASMFAVLDRLLFRAPDHVRDPENVVQVEERSAGSDFVNSSFSYAAYTDYRDHASGFQAVAASYDGEFPLDRGPNASHVPGMLVSSSFFPVLGVRPALGRFFVPDDDDADHPRNVAVISDRFWHRRFDGRDDALGQRLNIGAHDYTIIGIAPKGFTGIELSDVDIWLPITAPSGLRFDNGSNWLTNRGNTWLNVVARLKAGVNPQVAAEQATAAHRAGRRQQIAENPASAQYYKPDSERVVLAPIIPGKAATGVWGTVDARDVKVSKLLGVVSLIVLLIACANVANLLLVRAFGRRREIAVRLALGVSRSRLVGQLLVEGLLLSTLGGVGALLVAHWTSQSVRTLLIGGSGWTAEAVDGRMLAFAAATTVIVGMLVSLAPALRASHTDLALALKQGVREGGGQHSPMRSALLIVQAALAVVLLAGAGLFIRSVGNIEALPFGIDIDHVLVADVRHQTVGLSTGEANRLYHEFAERARGIPGVKSAAITVSMPFGMSWGVRVFIPGRNLAQRNHSPQQYVVTSDYFTTMGIRLVAGRLLSSDDRTGTMPVTVINQTMARLYWSKQNPIGQCVRIGADTMPCTTIVGVVTNTARQQLVEGLIPQFYLAMDQVPPESIDGTVSHFGYQLVVRTGGDAARFVEPVRRMMQSTAAIVPYATVRPMRDLLGRKMRAWDLGAKVFSAFGALALVLAAMGLYSVLAFTMAQRVHEFGVRTALGARATDLVRLTLTVGLAPVISGIGAGLAVVLLAGRFVAPLLFNVSPRDPTLLAGVSAILLGAGLVASLIPALRATRLDPAAVLRAD